MMSWRHRSREGYDVIETHKTFFPNRERFGLKIQGHGTGLPQKSWNEWIENDSEPQKRGAFTVVRNLNVVN